MTNPQNVGSLVETTEEKLGPITLLINNAGIGDPGFGPVQGKSEADWDRVFDTNLKGVFLISRAVAPLMIAVLAATILREAFTSQKRIGCTLIVVGVICIVWGAGGTIGTAQNIGHLLFLAAGLAWACYTVAMRRARLDGLHAAALAAVISLALYLPIYAYFAGTNVFKAPLPDIALQAIVQGFLTGIVALVLYGRMVAILGATGGAAFLALTPALTALMGIPILGELPSAIDWLAVVAISIGVYIVSGGPLPGRRALSPPHVPWKIVPAVTMRRQWGLWPRPCARRFAGGPRRLPASPALPSCSTLRLR